MKAKYIFASLLLALGVNLFVSCDSWTELENIKIQDVEDNSSLNPKSEEYWENLRAYKRSDHQLCFGWFGYWDGGVGASGRSSLSSAPDSIDIFSVFGKYMFNLTPEQIADMRYVQEVKGSKVVFTFLMQNVGFGFPQTPEGVIQYAHALCDTVRKYGYDGIDLDYEPNYGGAGYFSDKKEVARFVKELGKELGPMSGTNKVLYLDGEYDYILPEIVPYFNLAISQAYNATSNSTLDNRMRKAVAIGWKPEQFLVCEEFQKYASTGGVDFRLPDGTVVPSLIGMAMWQPKEGRKGGCGAFHMEFDYNNYPDWKYIREAIQIMNPAAK
ncbi:glycoside hydrolase family 18 [Phocaeicola sp. KGMB11183]|uniref:Glycoside hydrolase family 18 n=1 Tax=Phocaeicola acetigenes TaxID=3016083 RepID=A0ABT4PJ50_9BACT|nr:glycoside hydrolase family 18 [Phocaeicola sp. KGMB11183]MCZ8373019.1 glycoside hydrolase family 18 [Phocaeicola sp. KGMB11183]